MSKPTYSKDVFKHFKQVELQARLDNRAFSQMKAVMYMTARAWVKFNIESTFNTNEPTAIY